MFCLGWLLLVVGAVSFLFGCLLLGFDLCWICGLVWCGVLSLGLVVLITVFDVVYGVLKLIVFSCFN